LQIHRCVQKAYVESSDKSNEMPSTLCRVKSYFSDEHISTFNSSLESRRTKFSEKRSNASTQLRFGPYTILAWTAQSVNCHIALKATFYLLNTCEFITQLEPKQQETYSIIQTFILSDCVTVRSI